MKQQKRRLFAAVNSKSNEAANVSINGSAFYGRL